MAKTKEKRIEEIKACAMGIYEEAAKVYGNFEYPQDLQIIIDIQTNCIPTVTIKRSFAPTKLVEYLTTY